jgi:hypothetical protein
MITAESEMAKICAMISPHTPRDLCTTAEGVAWLVVRLQASEKALRKLEEIRCDRLAARGMGPEATAISASRHLLRQNAGGMARELAAQDSDNSNDING